MKPNTQYEIPVIYTNNQENCAHTGQHAQKKQKTVREETVSVDMDWKTLLILGLLIVIGMFVIGYNLRDTTVQDNILKIQTIEKDNRLQDAIIQKAQTKQLNN